MSDEAQTKPTLDTLLEIVKEMREEVRALREEVKAGFRNVDRQIGVLSKDIVQLRADVGDALNRLDNLEARR